ncbi:MAG TPA: hypothetical protein VFH51_09640 [Myxococcota bacterium]|nr:hypothetical protein [Myxococcota bacterium]
MAIASNLNSRSASPVNLGARGAQHGSALGARSVDGRDHNVDAVEHAPNGAVIRDSRSPARKPALVEGDALSIRSDSASHSSNVDEAPTAPKASSKMKVILGAITAAVLVGVGVVGGFFGPTAVAALAASSVGGPVALGICAGGIVAGGLAVYIFMRIKRSRAEKQAAQSRAEANASQAEFQALATDGLKDRNAELLTQNRGLEAELQEAREALALHEDLADYAGQVARGERNDANAWEQIETKVKRITERAPALKRPWASLA